MPGIQFLAAAEHPQEIVANFCLTVLDTQPLSRNSRRLVGLVMVLMSLSSSSRESVRERAPGPATRWLLKMRGTTSGGKLCRGLLPPRKPLLERARVGCSEPFVFQTSALTPLGRHFGNRMAWAMVGELRSFPNKIVVIRTPSPWEMRTCEDSVLSVINRKGETRGRGFKTNGSVSRIRRSSRPRPCAESRCRRRDRSFR